MAHDNDNSDKLLSRTEVEELFGIPKRFLEKSATTGEGPLRVYVGRLVRYRATDIRDWIESNVRGGGK